MSPATAGSRLPGAWPGTCRNAGFLRMKGVVMRSNQLVTILIVVVLVLLVIFLARAVF
jgi:hypothetical protein